MKKNRFSGFTLIEVGVVVTVLSMLLGLAWINLLGGRERSSQTATVDVFLSDLRAQQLRAMLGDTQGRVDKDTYGIFLGTTTYTLFHGPTYSPSDPTNSTIALGDNEVFQNILFPNSIIQFASLSGEIVEFSQGANSFVLSNTSLKSQKTIQLNKFGSVTLLQ